ncbi:MAG: radical SAM protein [Candidatus Hydrothermales bacterium]
MEISCREILSVKEVFPSVNFKEEGVVITGRDNSLFFFDGEGRLLYSFYGGEGIRVGLSGEIVLKFRKGSKKIIKRYSSLSYLKKVYKRVECVLEDDYFNSDREFLRDFLKRGFNNFKKTINDFKLVYGRVPIVPPDMYLSLYIQFTKGCSYNLCSFCNFYKGEKFRVLKKDEFISHIESVKKIFGKGIFTRRNIFLGDADALLLSEDKIFEYIEIVKRSFCYKNLDKVSSFLDVWAGNKKSLSFWRELRNFSLFRIYIGLESGCKELLDRLKKPFDPDEFLLLTENLKKAGISIGVIVLLGIGGDLEEEHKIETEKLLRKVNFDRGDILYLSPYYPFKGSFPSRVSELEIEREIEFFNSVSFKVKPKIAVYDIREFVY